MIAEDSFGPLPMRATPVAVFDAVGRPLARLTVRPEAEAVALLFEQSHELLRIVRQFDRILAEADVPEDDEDRVWMARVLQRIDHGSVHD